MPGTPVQHSHAPLVPRAIIQVRCACGAGFDSAAENVEAALEEVRQKHDHEGLRLRAATIDYGEHPLYQQRCPRCGETYLKCACKEAT